MKKLAVFAFFICLPFTVQAKPYLDIQEIKTPKGLTVWAVEDKTVPVVALKFSIKGGAQLDPAGKEGLGNLLTTLFDEGAGKRSSEEFQDEIDSHGIGMGFGVGRDTFSGNLRTTVKYEDLAFSLFDDALNRPHFDPEAVERMRQAVLSGLRYQQMDPNWIAEKTLYEQIFEGHPYARLTEGTPETVSALTVDDVKQQKDKLFCRNNLKIAVAGDIDTKKLAAVVDAIFGAWPKCTTELAKPMTALTHPGETKKVEWNGAQSTVLIAQSGLSRQDKDWWAARILDFALGGGEFSSRLMEEVRVKRGLTYGVETSLAPFDNGPVWVIQAGVDPTRTDMALDLIKKTWAEVAKEGLKEEEIKEAKDYLIGSLPLMLTSTNTISAILLQLQEDNLPKDTLDRRGEEIQSVTMDDIKRVARERLHADMLTTVIVGPNKEQNHEPAHPIPAVDGAASAHSDIR